MKIFKKFTIGLVLISILPALQAQSGRKVKGAIDNTMSAIVNKTEKPDLRDMLSNEKTHKSILNSLSAYYSDTLQSIRFEAYKITYSVAAKSSDAEIRQRAVEEITNGLFDAGSSTASWCARHLSVFNRNDFTATAKNNIIKGITSEVPKEEEIIKVAGYLQLTGAIPVIRDRAMFARKTEIKWAAYLALARMSQDDYPQKVVNIVKKQGLNDNVVYELIPDLIYTHQKVCVDLAVENLFEEKKLCSSSNPDNPQKMECGYRIMEYLAPVVKDFPFGVKTSGDIDTDDYPEALKKVREWFLSKGSNYEIIDTSF